MTQGERYPFEEWDQYRPLPPAEPKVTACPECGRNAGHAVTCPRYVPPPPPTCQRCKFWKEGASPSLCRRHAPGIDAQGYSVWPWTAPDDWCGEFERKEA